MEGMALGVHWEWRGFGPVSSDWRERFETLTPWWESQEVNDEYLWVPNLSVNIKFRKGVPSQEGLKFKRFCARDGVLEQWEESADEIFGFPLSQEAWATLRDAFQETGLVLPPYPGSPPDREAAIRLLKQAHSQVAVLKVRKRRQSRLWRSPQRRV